MMNIDLIMTLFPSSSGVVGHKLVSFGTTCCHLLVMEIPILYFVVAAWIIRMFWVLFLYLLRIFDSSSNR